jgi:hypothetical protein
MMAFLALSLLAQHVMAVEIAPATQGEGAARMMTWNEGLTYLRNPTVKDHSVALLFGGRWCKAARMIAEGKIKSFGVPVIVVTAAEEAINPLTDKNVRGLDIFRQFGGNAGSLAFLNDEGMPINYMVLPQLVHDCNPDLLTTYFRYVQTKSYRKVTLGEFCRAMGMEDVVVQSIKRGQTDGMGRVLSARAPVLKSVNDLTKEAYDPWDHPGYITVYTENPNGALFLAQVNEILYAFEAIQPRIAIVCPYGTRPPLDHLLGGDGLLLCNAAADDIIAGGTTPRIVFTGGSGAMQKGLELKGFQPANVLGALLNIRLTGEIKNLYPDIPLQEAEGGITLTEAGQLSILSIFDGKTAKDLRSGAKK